MISKSVDHYKGDVLEPMKLNKGHKPKGLTSLYAE